MQIPNADDLKKHHRELTRQAREFAEEFPARSWLELTIVLVCWASLFTIAALAPWWPVQMVAGLLLAGVFIRAFIFVHDHEHGALLPKSKLGSAIFYVIGLWLMTPRNIWRASHNTHHATNTNLDKDTTVGGFWLMTAEEYNQARKLTKVGYRINRSPAIMAAGWWTVFGYNMALGPFLKNPRENYHGAIGILMNVGVALALGFGLGWQALVFAYLMPGFIAAAGGCLLFYLQHTFEDMQAFDGKSWTYAKAALQSTSFLNMPRFMHWFTGNIGYHHIHHLNHRIPFYRLPEAHKHMEFRDGDVLEIRLNPITVIKSWRLALWDEAERRMISYRQNRKLRQQERREHDRAA